MDHRGDNTVSARLRLARELLVAIERDDAAAAHRALGALAELDGLSMHADLQRIATELREALCNVQASRDLARLTHRDLPDAQLRLNQVLELTEDAAHQTLAAVEEALPIAGGIGDAARRCLSGPATASRRTAAAGKELRQALGEIEAAATTLRACLSKVLMAQGFQDITGQMIRRVAQLVAELESCLAGRTPGNEGGGDPEAENLWRGTGPALAGRRDVVTGQQDVDDLLSELGV